VPGAVASGPIHPHLHTNGAATPPIIILFNALITEKRVLFLGYGKPAGLVANYVLASCAMASGSGCYLRGFTERAFPYANLTMKSLLDSVYVLFLFHFIMLNVPYLADRDTLRA